MTRSTIVHVFIDTNIALHYQRPDEIDWRTLTESKNIILVGAPILLRELENKKIINSSKKLKDRAKNYISWLHKFLYDTEAEVRTGVKWLFLPNEPNIDFHREGLSSEVADDHLIASVLDFINQPGTHVLVATADLGLRVKLLARNIKVLDLPDSLRLPEEADPLTRENEELKKQIEHYESRMPKLSVAFESGDQHHQLQIRDPDVLPLPPPLEQIQKDHPYIWRPGLSARYKEGAAAAASVDTDRLAQLFRPSTERIDAYNSELERYFQEYQDFLGHHAAWRQTMCLHYSVKFVVSNEGTASASNFDLELFSPKDVWLVNDGELPDQPKPPEAPRHPGSIPAFQEYSHLSPLMPVFPRDHIAKNYDGVPIISDDHNSACIWYPRLKHGFSHTSEELVFRFTSAEVAQAFSIDYRLSAEELPNLIEGKLHFKVCPTNS